MPGQHTGDTMYEGLRKILAQLAQLAITPDADLDFLSSAQQYIIDYLRTGNIPGQEGATPTPPEGAMPPDLAGALGGLGGEGAAPGGMPTDAMAGLPPVPAAAPSPMPMNGPAPGLAVGAPNMDELTRLLGSSQRAR